MLSFHLESQYNNSYLNNNQFINYSSSRIINKYFHSRIISKYYHSNRIINKYHSNSHIRCIKLNLGHMEFNKLSRMTMRTCPIHRPCMKE
mmetsp:Transcript_15719/g.21591  ORF Transcript_15719/g.21591 Transcript_15719/m.21591 type:complete len:90 (+) Transcript_15719:497-766(+)